jgi:1,2-diacylglycerol 3-alpha-glucosyltransferase
MSGVKSSQVLGTRDAVQRGRELLLPQQEAAMNVLMLTNSYLPNVCGVTRSVVSFTQALRGLGHDVLVVAPAVDPPIIDEPHVIRVPALNHVMANDIPLRLPIPGYLAPAVEQFRPDLVHVHHPFLLGSTGLRIAAGRHLPVVFTYHTNYEHYTHYLGGESAPLTRFTVRLATDFANQCDHVIAPSASMLRLLRERGVTVPISVIPTGIDTEAFAAGDAQRGKRRHRIPAEAFVVGHVGRLVVEKNLPFLARAVSCFLRREPGAHFLVVGDGPLRSEIHEICRQHDVADRLHLSDGELEGEQLADAYAAMDVLAFSSHSDTQGMVLAEAMAAGVPVVALDAPGARDIVRDRRNGRLLAAEEDFAAALAWVKATLRCDQKLRRALAATAAAFSLDRSVEQLASVYRLVCRAKEQHPKPPGPLASLGQRMRQEFQLWSRLGRAAYEAAFGARL